MTAPRLILAGYCSSNTARLLAVFDPPLRDGSQAHLHYKIRDQIGFVSTRTENALPYSYAFFEIDQLPSSPDGYWFHYSIDSRSREEVSLFEHRLKLLPDSRPLKIALLSCNGAYRVKDEDRRYVLWRALKQQIEAGSVDIVIHAGDQVYADSVAMQEREASGTTASERIDQLTSMYRKTYMDTWSAPDIADVLKSCPSLMMWDDHDIFDGYGSHTDDSSELAQTIFSAAKKAFWEFQARKNPPGWSENSFSFGLEIGKAAFLVLDCRTNRMWSKGRILGESGMKDVENWLQHTATRKTENLFVIMAIPFLHVPVLSYLKLLEITGSPGGLVEDLRDSWTASNNIQEGRALLEALFRFQAQSPGTRVVLLCGDVHVATVGTIQSTASNTSIQQIVSSGIGSPPPYGIVRMLLRWASSESVSLLGGEYTGRLKRLSSPENGFLLAKRNFAILDLAKIDRVQFFADYDGKVVSFEQSLAP